MLCCVVQKFAFNAKLIPLISQHLWLGMNGISIISQLFRQLVE